DPLAAGNARIGGLYFDQHGPVTVRLLDSWRIRVGLSALGFPWPAPSGIVDYTLRDPGEVSGIDGALYRGPFGVYGIDLDVRLPRVVESLGFAGGVAYRNDESLPDLTQRIAGYAAISQWTPVENATVKAFWG